MIDHQTFVNLISAFTLLAFVAGAGFGLAGYTSARRAALRDYIAHGQRQRIHAAQLDAMGADFLASQPSP